MLDIIVKDKQLLEFLIKKAAVKTNSKKVSDIFNEFVKLADGSTDKLEATLKDILSDRRNYESKIPEINEAIENNRQSISLYFEIGRAHV